MNDLSMNVWCVLVYATMVTEKSQATGNQQQKPTTLRVLAKGLSKMWEVFLPHTVYSFSCLYFSSSILYRCFLNICITYLFNIYISSCLLPNFKLFIANYHSLFFSFCFRKIHFVLLGLPSRLQVFLQFHSTNMRV